MRVGRWGLRPHADLRTGDLLHTKGCGHLQGALTVDPLRHAREAIAQGDGHAAQGVAGIESGLEWRKALVFSPLASRGSRLMPMPITA
jgi:hypothetical protein